MRLRSSCRQVCDDLINCLEKLNVNSCVSELFGRRNCDKFSRVKTCISLLLLSCGVSELWGQESRGSIVGTVSDASGAVVAGASVEILNMEMGTRNSLTTNAAG